MDAQILKVGDRVEHDRLGSGTVTFVGEDRFRVTLDDGRKKVIILDALEKEAPAAQQPVEASRETLPWPDSTFVQEEGEGNHSPGSHWGPFAEDPRDVLPGLPEMLSKASLQVGYGGSRQPPKSAPDNWPKGVVLTWPLRIQGGAIIFRIEKEEPKFISLSPFFATGSQHTLTLCKVSVWKSGLEAQITASCGDTTVTFFDTEYPINRDWYETGKDYDFILTGVAYRARPAEKQEFEIEWPPGLVERANQYLKEGQKLYGEKATITLDGAAMFFPIREWDVDDYSFHAPVKRVETFTDWLGQDGWKVRATVMRLGDKDFDLDIVITKRAWLGDTPPQVGQDIEGQLWLQGYLCWIKVKEEITHRWRKI